MVVVAVAGTGLVGKQVIQSLLASEKHTVIVLSRSQKPDLAARGAIVKIVDYSSIPSLVAALSNSPDPVHTVISCLVAYDPSEMVQSQVNLLQAAKEAGAKRFAPSEFATVRAANEHIEFYREVKNAVWKAAEESELEITAFTCGIFMNYLAFGSSTADAQKELEGIENPFAFIVDIKNGKAEIPGTGKEPVAFTRWQDVGKFVAAAVELEKWEEELSMVGDIMSYDDVVRLAEEVTGKRFEVVKRPTEDLRREADLKTGMTKFYLEARLVVGLGLGSVEPRLNKLVDVQPMGLKEFITKCWKGHKQL